ncbi:hypothetical protein L484_026619 [Morus notabilis]|uniref:Uncharacterized protein n=1 Tax=Morus notabilis TaxID=981085 RepID=W9SKG1_9ROSA|nr:hypothetical protein L484_026619 [Morus notabilis]
MAELESPVSLAAAMSRVIGFMSSLLQRVAESNDVNLRFEPQKISTDSPNASHCCPSTPSTSTACSSSASWSPPSSWMIFGEEWVGVASLRRVGGGGQSEKREKRAVGEEWGGGGGVFSHIDLHLNLYPLESARGWELSGGCVLQPSPTATKRVCQPLAFFCYFLGVEWPYFPDDLFDLCI